MRTVMAEMNVSPAIVHEEQGQTKNYQDCDAEKADDQQKVGAIRRTLFNIHAG